MYIFKSTEYQGNMIWQKEIILQQPNPKHGILKSDKELNIDIMKKFNRLQENTERKFSELRNKINEHKEFFIKEIEILKNDQTEIQNLVNVVKNAIQSISNRASEMKERVSGLVNRNTETIQSGEKRESRFLKSEETLQEL